MRLSEGVFVGFDDELAKLAGAKEEGWARRVDRRLTKGVEKHIGRVWEAAKREKPYTPSKPFPIGKVLAGTTAVVGTAALGHHLWKKHKEKTAVDMHQLLGNAGAAGGVGALLGAGGGALVGGVRKYRQARAEGANVGQGVAHGVGGALHGAGTGALVGAGAGALYGGAAPQAFHRGLSQVGGLVGAGARFGQRQVHSLTGWLPKAGDPSSLETLRGGAFGARQTLGKAKQELAAAKRHGVMGGALRSAEKSFAHAGGALEGAVKAQDMGLTSIPGYARSLAGHPIDTLRTGLTEQWHSGGIGSKALMVGLPAAGAAAALRSKEGLTGPGKGERIGQELGSTAGFLATAPLGMLPGTLVSSAAGKAGALVGRGVDRLRGRHAVGGQGQLGEGIR